MNTKLFCFDPYIILAFYKLLLFLRKIFVVVNIRDVKLRIREILSVEETRKDALLGVNY